MKYGKDVLECPIESSRPTRGAWIEISVTLSICSSRTSRPTRGAWIEITSPFLLVIPPVVAPHTGRVD